MNEPYWCQKWDGRTKLVSEVGLENKTGVRSGIGEQNWCQKWDWRTSLVSCAHVQSWSELLSRLGGGGGGSGARMTMQVAGR
ncbi:hypothetical protein LSTR_LSTR005202 [Laodelphax striatellus]|uniref:Uncharacterized protein n=1 Tax=Laodelphax striatellus TaxID=195883 RepID=A0A482XNF6_LAOST|nr:hypothetical protein LSTR_LSTR005202 [Laodelphax striatellus]